MTAEKEAKQEVKAQKTTFARVLMVMAAAFFSSLPIAYVVIKQISQYSWTKTWHVTTLYLLIYTVLYILMLKNKMVLYAASILTFLIFLYDIFQDDSVVLYCLKVIPSIIILSIVDWRQY